VNKDTAATLAEKVLEVVVITKFSCKVEGWRHGTEIVNLKVNNKSAQISLEQMERRYYRGIQHCKMNVYEPLCCTDRTYSVNIKVAEGKTLPNLSGGPTTMTRMPRYGN
jgi:hypothetical protein